MSRSPSRGGVRIGLEPLRGERVSSARIGAFAAVGALAAGGFAIIANSVAGGDSAKRDRRTRSLLESARCECLDILSLGFEAAGAPALIISITALVAFALRGRGRHIWLPIAISPLLAMTAGRTFTELLPQPPAPTGDRDAEASFPSGHTTGATAELFTIASVLHREEIIGTAAAVGISLVPLMTGANRVYRGRHWASDVIAGWCAGTTIAAVCAIAHEAGRSRATRAIPGQSKLSATMSR